MTRDLIDKAALNALINRKLAKDEPDLADELRAAIAALPAVAPVVKPLAWEVMPRNSAAWKATCPITGHGYRAFDEQDKSDQDARRIARILAALDLTPAPATQPDPEDDLVYRRHRCIHVAEGADAKCPICWPDDAQPAPAAHVNETPKTEHDAGNALSPAASREAARLLLSDDAAISRMSEAPLDREHTPEDFEAARQIMRDALTALIQKKEPTDDR